MDIMGSEKPNSELEVGAAANAAHPPQTSALSDVTEFSQEDDLNIGDEQDSFVETYTKRNKFVGSAVNRMIAILLMFVLVLGGWRLAVGDKKRRVLGEKVPTDEEGIRKMVEDLVMSTQRFSDEWNSSSREVRDAFNSNFTCSLWRKCDTVETVPEFLRRNVGNIDALSHFNTEVGLLERRGRALRVLLWQAVAEAGRTRLKQLKDLEIFSERNEDCPLVMLRKYAGAKSIADYSCKDGEATFGHFCRRLAAWGFVGLNTTDDSGPVVPVKLADRVADLVYLKKAASDGDAAVTAIFDTFVATVERAQQGLDDAERERLEGYLLDVDGRQFPISRLARHISTIEDARRDSGVTAADVEKMRKGWSAGGLQRAAIKLLSEQHVSYSVSVDIKRSSLHGWIRASDLSLPDQTVLEVAIALT
ncbi:hypothetical protein EAH_00027440 [Eimeria acervulina]|uniref:Uncharacterized protein n=1 Tax=Eimeria acervulina TaxID=5801 RepID=U6GSV3_EIMAC|nr:hypothetical protein EAH_00027440 [Eimeria acervulina]CDI82358.1 hypothetical protein EAH_00027440 [Eimeria acervulina]